MGRFKIKFKKYGDNGLLIEWPNKIDETILIDICNYSEIIRARNIEGIIDINIVYTSMLVSFNNQLMNVQELTDILKDMYQKEISVSAYTSKTIEIPVCYDEKFSTDLNEYLQIKNIQKSDFIALHCATSYTVYGVGFLPGFLYLGGLNEKLFLPRKEIPNLNVLKGSVAIGGEQTGIYPQNSPGGWHVIGSTPINLFDPNNENPTLLKAGDKVQFKPISKSEYELIKIQIETNIYNFKEVV